MSDELKHQIIAMDNLLAKQSHNMSIEYQKMFYIALSHINETNSKENNEVIIDKKSFFELLNATDTNRHARYRKMWQKLRHMTSYDFGNDEEYVSGDLITRVISTKNKYHVYFEREFMPLLTQLSGDYTRLLRNDIIEFKSSYSTILYQQLMRLQGFRYRGIDFSTKQIKDMFGLDKDAYVYLEKKKDKNGNIKETMCFKRPLFEKKTIDVAVKEINETSKCIRNLKYEKTYDNRKQVDKYVFYYDYIDPQQAKERNPIEEQPIKTTQKENDISEEIKNFNWWD